MLIDCCFIYLYWLLDGCSVYVLIEQVEVIYLVCIDVVSGKVIELIYGDCFDVDLLVVCNGCIVVFGGDDLYFYNIFVFDGGYLCLLVDYNEWLVGK